MEPEKNVVVLFGNRAEFLIENHYFCQTFYDR